MRDLSYFVASILLLSILVPAASAAEPSDTPEKKPVAEKKAEPEKKPDAKTEEAPKEKEQKSAEPAESKPAAEPKSKPAESKPEAKKAVAKPEAPKLDTHTVEADMLKIDLELEGVFVAQNMTRVELRPETWSTFKVVKAVEHGERVEKGDVLVEFDAKKIDEAIADRETSQELAALSLKQAELGLELLEKTAPIDLELAERQKRMMTEDLKRFLEIDVELSKKSAEYSLKSSEESLEYQLEELKQLEKMYNADDLTEETEEIILKRQRNAVERARFYLELAKNRYDESVNVYLPRNKESMQYSADLLDLSIRLSKETIPIELERERIAVEKLKIEQKRSHESFDKLKEDRKLMTLTAPASGIVYYGKFVRGKWSGATTVADKLVPDSSASTGALMTIVTPRPMLIRATVSEKDLHWVKKGMKGTVTPTSLPDSRATATISEMPEIMRVDGSYAAIFRVSLTGEMDSIMPGMKCKVKLVPYLKKRTLVIPEKAIETDEFDDTRHYVQLVNDTGKPVRQSVTIGKKKDDVVEILDGLAKGDKILAEYPKDKD